MTSIRLSSRRHGAGMLRSVLPLGTLLLQLSQVAPRGCGAPPSLGMLNGGRQGDQQCDGTDKCGQTRATGAGGAEEEAIGIVGLGRWHQACMEWK